MNNPDGSFKAAASVVSAARPGAAESAWLRPALIAGCYTGAALTVAMLGALVVANRIPSLEGYAFERNAVSYALFVMLMLVPVLRFITRPVRIFVASMTAWVLLTAAYDFAGFYFRDLFAALHRTPFEVLAEGAVVYGIVAVAAWVCATILHARRHPMARRVTRPGAMSCHR